MVASGSVHGFMQVSAIESTRRMMRLTHRIPPYGGAAPGPASP